MNVHPPPLSTIIPPLPETLVTNLSALNIRTAPDFIFVSPAELLRRLPPGSITFQELKHHIVHVTQAFAGPAITGDKLIEELDALAHLEPVRSGLPALDDSVGGNFGGASGGRVIEISGPSASGKTVCS
jgi:RAD51-like protein 3